MKYLLKNRIALIILILSIWLVPITISVPEQSRTETIVTAIGVDKKNDEIELSLQYIIPSAQNETKNLNISSYKAKTLGEAMEGLNLQLGKLAGFAHCRFFILNYEASKENVTNILDYLLRRKTNTNNIVLISTPTSAKEILETAQNLDSDLYAFLNNSGFSNELKDYHDLKTIGDYYQNYFEESKAISINVLEAKEKENNNSSQLNSEPKKLIVNEGKIDIFKNNKKIVSLTKEQSMNLSFFDEGITKTYFVVKDFSNDDLKNATILFDVKRKDLKKDVYFVDGIPHFKLNIKMYVRIGQIEAENLSQRDYETIQKKFSDKLKEEMNKGVISKLKEAEKNFKENNYDTIDCYNLFKKFKNKEWKEFIEKLESKDEYIKHVIFDYNVSFVQGD